MFNALIKIKIEKIVNIIEKFCNSSFCSIKEKYNILIFNLESILTADKIKIKKIIILIFEEIFFLSSTSPIKKNINENKKKLLAQLL